MRHVLFVCNHNAGRSQMAHAFFDRWAPDDVRAESAGSEPADAPWPEVVEVMHEVGIDISANQPRKLDLEMQLHADWAITLGCGGACPYVPSMVEDWNLPDPNGRPIDEVRAIRDEIERRVRDLIDDRLDAIRTDPTAHRVRLNRLLPSLVEEFGGTIPDAESRACADQMLTPYDDAPVRSFVLTLAHSQARECLREGRCATAA